jgi:hypothetical protein
MIGPVIWFKLSKMAELGWRRLDHTAPIPP